MRLILLAKEDAKNEFLTIPPRPDCEIVWLDHVPPDEPAPGADLVIDLLSGNHPDRTQWLQQPSFRCVMVNGNAENLPPTSINFNGWPGFLQRGIIEAWCENAVTRQLADGLVSSVGRTIEWMPAVRGFISQRIISAIINEAFLSAEEGIADEQAIDTAMKLGTNYPFGPFEWAARIGYKNIVDALAVRHPAPVAAGVSMLLKEKALAQ